MQKVEVLEEFIKASKAEFSDGLRSIFAGIEYGHRQLDFQHVGWVVAHGCNELLRVAMAEYRVHRSIDEALQTLASANPLLDALESAFIQLGG